MLTSALKVLINNSFQESFDITFIENEKKFQNITAYIFFHKNFLLNRLLNNITTTFVKIFFL